MNEKNILKYKKIIMLSGKIGLGSCIAILIAQYLELEFAASAGIITLLTLITTKWETLKLSVLRVVTFMITVAVSYIIFHYFPVVWLSYGIFLFIIVIIVEVMGWRSTLSVNAVIGTHFLTTHTFRFDFVINELSLVLIGIGIAIILNLFDINSAQEIGIIRAMRHVEEQMKIILTELAGYLSKQSSGKTVWDDLTQLERELDEHLQHAYEYERNTFHSHTRYYMDYFEMRMKQCGALHNLHYSMRRMRDMPVQANIVAEYILEISKHITEMNDPQMQIDRLEKLLEDLRNHPLPVTHEEFENRAELYHIVSDLEEFIMYKKRFIHSIDAKQFQVYWKKEIQDKEKN